MFCHKFCSFLMILAPIKLFIAVKRKLILSHFCGSKNDTFPFLTFNMKRLVKVTRWTRKKLLMNSPWDFEYILETMLAKMKIITLRAQKPGGTAIIIRKSGPNQNPTPLWKNKTKDWALVQSDSFQCFE